MNGKNLMGYDLPFCVDLSSELDKTFKNGFSFYMTDVFHPLLKENVYSATLCTQRTMPSTRSDFLYSGDVSRCCVGRVSPWIDVDHADEWVRANSEHALLYQLQWMAHISLPCAVIPLRRRVNHNLARILTKFLATTQNAPRIWLEIPIQHDRTLLTYTHQQQNQQPFATANEMSVSRYVAKSEKAMEESMMEGEGGGGQDDANEKSKTNRNDDANNIADNDKNVDQEELVEIGEDEAGEIEDNTENEDNDDDEAEENGKERQSEASLHQKSSSTSKSFSSNKKKQSEAEQPRERKPPPMFNANVSNRVEQSWNWPEDSWEWWREFSTLVQDHLSCFMLVLTLPECILPPRAVMQRWLAEPLAAVILHTRTFYTNESGFPVLSRAHQQLMHRFFRLNIQVVLRGRCLHPPANRFLAMQDNNQQQKEGGRVVAAAGDRQNTATASHAKSVTGISSYQRYIQWLYKVRPVTRYEKESNALADQLQIPLQPLAEDLSSETYSVFEIDPFKYSAYQQAMERAMLDQLRAEEFVGDPARRLVLMVLGAGRGPLVSAAFMAADLVDCQHRLTVYIVEKNVKAQITLRNKMRDEWGHRDVHLVCGDMRKLEQRFGSAIKADIFVSELLGSFGDNELSPECLDGAEKYLKKNGVSIPQSYTSYLAPITSTRFYRELLQQSKVLSDSTNRSKTEVHEIASFETFYVVNLVNYTSLATPHPVFTFSHPRASHSLAEEEISHSRLSIEKYVPDLPGHHHNQRYAQLEFEPVSQSAVLHAFAGYFTANLYKGIEISTHPHTHSKDMFSWFPLVVPLRTPVHLQKGDRIRLNMWRVTSDRQVHYEWNLVEPRISSLHNPGGRSYHIDL